LDAAATETLVIGRGDRAAGKTLAELDLRRTTGATVVRGKAIPGKKRDKVETIRKDTVPDED
jgi:K+/H+ antiporter YhaU regulatory subunit KhtT